MPSFFYGPLLAGRINKAAAKIEAPYYIENENKNGALFSFFASSAAHFFSKEETIENVEMGTANNGIDYTKNYLSEPPFFGIGFEFSNSAGFGGGLKSEIHRPFYNDYFETFNIALNGVDKNFMQEGYIYYDNPYVYVLVGRINTQLGFLYSDTLFFNNNIPYTDSVRLFLPFGDYFNMHWQITNISSVESVYQKDVVTGNAAGQDSPDYFYGFEDDDFPSLILNTYQRFGFQNNFINAGLAFNVFLVRRNNRFEFVDVFAFSEWHASDVVPNNFSVGLDFSIVPKENLFLSAQLGFDEINGSIIGISDSEIPTIWSFIGTMQNTMSNGNIDVFLSTNVGYTHYLWGNFSGKSVGDAAETGLSKALYRYHLQNPMYIPYTSDYGPGTIWASVETIINFKQNGYLKNLCLKPTTLFLLREPNTNLIDTPYKNRDTSVPKEIYFAMEFPASYSWKAFEASVSPSFHVTGLNKPTIFWFELKLSLRVDFSVSFFEEATGLKQEVFY